MIAAVLFPGECQSWLMPLPSVEDDGRVENPSRGFTKSGLDLFRFYIWDASYSRHAGRLHDHNPHLPLSQALCSPLKPLPTTATTTSFTTLWTTHWKKRSGTETVIHKRGCQNVLLVRSIFEKDVNHLQPCKVCIRHLWFWLWSPPAGRWCQSHRA